MQCGTVFLIMLFVLSSGAYPDVLLGLLRRREALFLTADETVHYFVVLYFSCFVRNLTSYFSLVAH